MTIIGLIIIVGVFLVLVGFYAYDRRTSLRTVDRVTDSEGRLNVLSDDVEELRIRADDTDDYLTKLDGYLRAHFGEVTDPDDDPPPDEDDLAEPDPPAPPDRETVDVDLTDTRRPAATVAIPTVSAGQQAAQPGTHATQPVTTPPPARSPWVEAELQRFRFNPEGRGRRGSTAASASTPPITDEEPKS